MHIHLNLKRKWFDMIKAGEKPEEYREIKEYWARRLLVWNKEQEYLAFDEMLCDMKDPLNRHESVEDLMQYFNVDFKQFDNIHFRNGYSANAPEFQIPCLNLTIARGRESWGAEPGKYYFVFRLGNEN